MTELADIYTAERYRQRAGYRARYRQFAEAIWQLWRPAAVLDLGCGAGWLVEWFAERRVPVTGVDGSAAVLEVLPKHVRPLVSIQDLRDPPPIWLDAFEFVVCIEVAEHIEPEAEAKLLRWFRKAQRVFLTAAPPGQGGHHHVNEQPPEHWIERFAQMGFHHRPAQTEAWQQAVLDLGKGCGWVRRNAMFFARGIG